VHVIRTVADLRTALHLEPNIALVPTMGNLHAGHLSLVRIAQLHGDLVVTSIFVNRLQFAPHEDFATYPRTLERDCELLDGVGCDIVFAPADGEIYPQPQGCTVHPPAALADILEGAARPGFFAGVCTVVLKLFNMVQPDTAIFGKKDYQQLRVIQNMVRQLSLPIEIVPAETVRDPRGLALSSRNGYLSDSLLPKAAQLQAALGSLAAAVRSGRSDWRALEHASQQSLSAAGWAPDYVAIRRQSDLKEPSPGDPLVALAAAKLDGTRLIDNLEI
jgi:pantoate--beta-alanine ligase